MSDRQKRSLSMAVLSLALIALLVVTVTMQQGHAEQPVVTHEPPERLELATLLMRAHEVGLSPEAMVAAGVSREQVGQLCDVLRLWDEDFLELESAAANARSIQQDLSMLEARLRRQGGTPALQTRRSELQTQLAAQIEATAVLRGVIAHQFVAHRATIVGVDGSTIIERYFENQHRKVPDHMRALDLSEQEWRDLEVALVKQKIDGELYDSTLTPAESAVLARANADATVALVQGRLSNNMASEAVRGGLAEMVSGN